MVNCFAAASIDLISPIACLAAMFGSSVVWANETGLNASVISPIAAAKKNFLITGPFCLLSEHRKTRIYDWQVPDFGYAHERKNVLSINCRGGTPWPPVLRYSICR